MIFSIDDDSDERAEAVNDWFDASQREKIAEALLDENGLRPTHAALDVLMAVVQSLDYTDEHHAGRKQPVPDFNRYALDVEQKLRIARKGHRNAGVR